MTINVGPGTLWSQDPATCEWHKIGVMTKPMEVHHVAPPEQLAVVRPRALKGMTVSWTLSRRQTRQLADALFPGWRWRYWDGRRARREYDGRRRARRRRNRR